MSLNCRGRLFRAVPKSYLVVGGGLQGLVAARALARGPGNPDVVVADVRAAAPNSKLHWEQLDVKRSPQRLRRLASQADACVVALPGAIADTTVAALSRVGARVADMSFVPEPDLPSVDRSARRSGAVVVRDVGVAPGLSHILAADCVRQLGTLDNLTIYVGGIPRDRPRNAFRHAVYFNALDLISEYTRPARCRRGGRDIAVDPLSRPSQVKVRDATLGGLEAFLSDGLRTLLTSYPNCPEMFEYTLRWPGHLREMRRLRDEGLLASKKQGGSPSRMTAIALEEAFPGDAWPDVLLLEVHARRGRERVGWRLFARRSGGLSAMGRTTGFTAATAARALAEGHLSEPGLHGPERLGKDTRLRRFVLEDLARQGLQLRPNVRISS